MSNWEKIESNEDELKKLFRAKRKDYNEVKLASSLLSKKTSQGWELIKSFKNGKSSFRKLKTHAEKFEDRVWSLFYSMSFRNLNGDNQFVISYGKENKNLTKQIDVFAMDDETVIVVECKSTQKVKTSNFKTEIESYSGIKSGIIKSIVSEYPGKKICFIWATNNYEIGNQDVERLKDNNIIHFSESTISYFENLSSHLGSASKYQLLGYLFPNKKIKELEVIVPAIKGKLGGHVYYSFSMRPIDLLKFSYILHRNNANNEMLPTYQRLVKKNRLDKIRTFIKEKGYFPNSIIINLNEDGKFEQVSNTKVKSSGTRLGFLELPRKYRSAYIIDGQHRVYGYSDTDYASSHTIPVIAFVNLKQSEQVKMFMDINENQKSVSKLLRNTLIKDLFLESKDLREVRVAQSLIVADKLGSIRTSPLYKRVLIGENKKTDHTSITLENLKIAIQKNSDFLNKYDKNNILTTIGTFDFNDTDRTTKELSDFLIRMFDYIRGYLEIEWNKGVKEGFLATNNFLMAIIYIVNDFVNSQEVNATSCGYVKMFKLIEPQLLELIQVIESLDYDQIASFKKMYGAGAPTKIYKELGYQVSLLNVNYSPKWLSKYIEDHKQDNILESKSIVSDLKFRVISICKTKKPKDIGLIDFVDKNTYQAIKSKMVDEEYRQKELGETKVFDEWEVMSFAILDQLMNSKSNWKNIFRHDFSKIESLDGYKPRDFLKALESLDKKLKNEISLSVKELEWVNYLKNYFEQERFKGELI